MDLDSLLFSDMFSPKAQTMECLLGSARGQQSSACPLHVGKLLVWLHGCGCKGAVIAAFRMAETV